MSRAGRLHRSEKGRCTTDPERVHRLAKTPDTRTVQTEFHIEPRRPAHLGFGAKADKPPNAYEAVAVAAVPVPHHSAWPAELRTEADVLLGALVPRGAMWFFVANRNRRAELVPLDRILPELRRRFRESTGGPTRIATQGEYVPVIGPEMEEDTLVLLVILPKRVDDALRSEILDICIQYGCATEQEEVLVLANNTGVWLPTGRLLDSMTVTRALKVRAGMNGSSACKPRSDNRRDGALPFLARPRRPATRRG